MELLWIARLTIALSSDNRIRGWLREHGIAVPMRTSRQELLQKMRENCVSTLMIYFNEVCLIVLPQMSQLKVA